MQSSNPKIPKFKYMQSRKVNGGVGVKKQSIHQTPIRLSTIARNITSDYTVKSSFADPSNSKITSFKAIKNTNEKRQSKPIMPISMSIDISTPKGGNRNFIRDPSNNEITVLTECQNSLAKYINTQNSISK